MNALKSASMIACVCCIACSVVSLITPMGRMRKTVNLILGLFIICSMLIPVVGLVTTKETEFSLEESVFENMNSEEEYEKLVLNETADNLVKAANDLLLSENIEAENISIGIKRTESDSIYISRINIYINKDYENMVEDIKRIISINMSKEPVVIIIEN